MPSRHSPGASLRGAWLWAFPITQALHGAEEYWAGYSFHRSLNRLSAFPVSASHLLALHSCFLLAMTLGVILIQRRDRWSWLVPCLGSLVLINGLIHLLQSLLLGAYASGLASGAILWIPLGSWSLWRSRSCDTRAKFWAGLLVGLGMEIPLAWIALNAGGIATP